MIMLIDRINTAFNKILSFLIIYILLFLPKCFAETNKEIRVGILLGFTGLVESLTPSMADSAELAFNEVTNKDLTFKVSRADTTCNNINSAINAADKLVNEGVSAIIGGACPNVTKEIAKSITVPNKILTITPADNSNELITLKDNGYLFRTTPSKIRGSEILADITSDRGVKK